MTSLFSLMLSLAHPAQAENTYQKPETMINKLVQAESFSQPVFNWQKTALIKAYFEELPSIDYVSRPQLKLGGARFSPQNYTAISNMYVTRLVYFDFVKGIEKPLPFPKNSILRELQWAPNGKNLVVSLEKADCQELWMVAIPSLKKTKIPGVCLNSVLGRTVQWINAQELLIGVRTANQKKSLTVESIPPRGPIIQKTRGEVSQNRTFADLLKTPQDEKAFAAATEMQLAIYNVQKQKVKKIGKPGMFARVDLSPNRKFILVETLQKPFSYVVPYSLFGKKIDLWTLDGKVAHNILTRPAAENIPIQGVMTGPRNIQWAKNEEQTLFYVEALDQGDWAVKVDFRDELFRLDIPTKGKLKPESILKLKNRYAGVQFLENEKAFLVDDYERDRRWFITFLVTPQDGAYTQRPMFSLSIDDDYNNPGDPLLKRDQNGEAVIAVERGDDGKRHVYFAGPGASPEGERPFLRKYDLETFQYQEIFRSDKESYERVMGFADDRFERFFTSYQSQTEIPRVLIRPLKAAVTDPKLLYTDPNPYEILSKIKKEMITYKRKDGVLLSGVLYYPLNYKPGKKYPAIIQAYPLEYADASTAGQVRGSQNKFARPYHEDIVYNALRGYIVLNNAQMPIIGHPETKNDTFIEQLVAGAKAAVDTLDERGLIERDRVGIIGHSYGAFMVAHLLTHSDLFATGIAKSGAYNRTLTPYGFQGERRPFWKAKDTYIRMSPFMDVDKLKKPILLMHGMADNNSGTLTMQTERYFEALKGQGVDAKLVLLPEESHGYAARESISHVLYEIFNWFDTYLKK